MSITITIPEEFGSVVGNGTEERARRARESIALELYREGRISLRAMGRLAGLGDDYWAAFSLRARFGVSVLEGEDPEEEGEVPDPPAVVIRIADWETDHPALLTVRRAVFTIERGASEELEVDGEDPRSLHVIAEADGRPIAIARMKENGHIDRVAVVCEYRRRGLGCEVMRALLKYGDRRGITRSYLHAEVSTLGFYRSLGFVAEGPVFDEDGLPHQLVVRNRERAK